MATSVDIDDELGGRIRRLAEQRQQPPERIIQEAIKEYADRAEIRESFMREADASWTSYQDDGLHLSATELRVWLETWGTEFETRLPECHE